MNRLRNLHFPVIISMLLIITGCNRTTGKSQLPPYSESEKQLIKTFAHELTDAINRYDYTFMEKSWDYDLFVRRVKVGNQLERNMLHHLLEERGGKKQVYYVNIDLINKLKERNGRVTFSKIIYYPRHAEVIYTMLVDKSVDFWKYYIQLSDGNPKLSDYYTYKSEKWQSDNIAEFLELNAEYTAVSKERWATNIALQEAEEHIANKSYEEALSAMYSIPETHHIGNVISMKRLELASHISDTVFAEVLLKEQDVNNSLYIQYLYAYHFGDTLVYEEVFSRLQKELGITNAMLDSMQAMNYTWQ